MITQERITEVAASLMPTDRESSRHLAHAFINSTQSYFGGRNDFSLQEKKIALIALAVLLQSLDEMIETQETLDKAGVV